MSVYVCGLRTSSKVDESAALFFTGDYPQEKKMYDCEQFQDTEFARTQCVSSDVFILWETNKQTKQTSSVPSIIKHFL